MDIISATILDGCIQLNYSNGSFDLIFIGEEDAVCTARLE